MSQTADRVAVVLAAHGAPATDYPPMRVGLLMMLEFGGGPLRRLGFLRRWRERLADETATWPRTGRPVRAVRSCACRCRTSSGGKWQLLSNEVMG